VTVDPELSALRAHYDAGIEKDRLDSALGLVEFERTKEIVSRHLPRPPARVADIGGGPGRYAVWLAQAGHEVILRDIVPRHVDEARESAGAARVRIDVGLGDARSLDLEDGSVDGVLLLGPLYHLERRDDRVRALREARRIVRPGGIVHAAAISRWTPRLHAVVVLRAYERFPQALDLVADVERSGRLPPLFPGDFTGYCHRPGQLRAEVRSAGLTVLDMVGVEGMAFALPDLQERLQTDQGRAVVLDAARALERVPEMLGLAPHLIVTATRPP
jgi:SAM-dependent methyltransferase